MIQIQNGYYEDSKYKKRKFNFRLSRHLIAGDESIGRNNLLSRISTSSIQSGKKVLVIGDNSGNQFNGFVYNFINTNYCNSNIIDINTDLSKAKLNLFKGLSQSQIIEMLILILNEYTDVTNELEMFVNIYLNNIFKLLSVLKSMKFTLNNISTFNKNWIEDTVFDLTNKNKLNQKDISHFQEFIQIYLPNYNNLYFQFDFLCKKIEKVGLGDILSRNESFTTMIQSNDITYLNLDFNRHSLESTILFKLVLERVLFEKSHLDITLIFENLELHKFDRFQKILSKFNNVFFTIKDMISWQDTKFQLSAYCDGIFVFRQTSFDNREIFSKWIGSYKAEEVTQNTEKYSKYHKDADWMLKLLNWNKDVKTGKSTQIVDKQIVEAQDLLELDDDTCYVVFFTSKSSYIRPVKWA